MQASLIYPGMVRLARSIAENCFGMSRPTDAASILALETYVEKRPLSFDTLKRIDSWLSSLSDFEMDALVAETDMQAYSDVILSVPSPVRSEHVDRFVEELYNHMEVI